ncbi:conserved hypothetical protein [Burkholderia mallei PRL-20]|uniref:Uncharacterized protein n=2 Tax=pseudomallei group TaxID=111527 RepID=A2S4U7_BURM9|nr:hypothetical protein BMASAVP1_A2605 [Burkholderia mallei SAVP1]ABN00745.1 hypothetical protein BMA10229_A0977 [Burkholderia mallei NCTC 10229]ABN81889.1 hypothetical protein BURPS668_2914 [Burkholderia pseudomallei 668]ABN88927.1 hypothetical protein BURPS1106A_2974 [Burkholderia pseudomallei 1106a]ABO06819.1 hypothetical protein BMA10247_0170 [Burkholderia mallei NCTC 10247]AFR16862.1 hypothetical protein BPC006_I3009 [Burkholderia pseudomallei BPC006]EDK52546.1 hypothetical protein BMAFM
MHHDRRRIARIIARPYRRFFAVLSSFPDGDLRARGGSRPCVTRA